MRHWLPAFAILAIALSPVKAQLPSFGDVPIEINAENSRFVGGLAVAEGNVEIVYGETTIYSDYGQYNPETRDVLVTGNVRFYRDGKVMICERAVYNLETKQLRTSDVRADFYPMKFAADSMLSIGSGNYKANDAIFTTSDSSKPDYTLHAKSVRIYPKDRIVMSNVTVYVGKVPVFWYPYLYQSLKKDQSFSYSPGYTSIWGVYVLTQATFPISENVTGQVRLDLRSLRGVAGGFNLDFKYGKDNRDWGRFQSYYVDDLNPSINKTGFARQPIDPSRYRFTFQHRLFVTDDIYANINVNILSDVKFLQDFFPHEFRIDPQPDNAISLTKLSENYTLTGVVRGQINDFYGVTERLPEVSLDVKRHAIFNSPIFYEGETSAGLLRRTFAANTGFPNYSATRLDTFHQFLLPQTYFDWLSFIPRAGGRLTYYSESGGLNIQSKNFNQTLGILDLSVPGEVPHLKGTVTRSLSPQGPLVRPVFEAGAESSFKLSRAYEAVQSRAWGLDGLRHVVQPYTDFSYVLTNKNPSQILQFDRLNPSDQLPPLDFPQFTPIDSIGNWTKLRLGVRNNFETRRDNRTFNWLAIDTYLDWNINQPAFMSAYFDEGTFSNVINKIRFNPLPWVNFQFVAQLPLLNSGFTEFNSDLNFLASDSLSFTIGQRYIRNNPFFQDSNLLTFGTYLRINDNWGFSVREQYEVHDHILETQRYELHRDLSSWIASLGFLFGNNHRAGANNSTKGSSEFGFMLTFTLKDLPQVNIPIGQNPNSGSSVKGQ